MEIEAPNEDSCPEDRELARVLRELGRIFPGHSKIDWPGSRRWCGDILAEIIKDSPVSRRLTELLENTRYESGGDEHHIIAVEDDPERVYKFTHGDNFGCRSYFSASDPELTGRHFHGETNADPFFYLERWLLLNSIGGYKSRFEGFILPQRPDWLPRICISQPELDSLNPTVAEIRASLAQYGFFEVSDGAFYDADSGLLLTDAAPRNVRIIDGIPVPFDAIAQIPIGRTMEWCVKKYVEAMARA